MPPVASWKGFTASSASRKENLHGISATAEIPEPLSQWGPSWNRSFGVELEFMSTLPQEDLIERLQQGGHAVTTNIEPKGNRRRTPSVANSWTLHTEECTPGSQLFSYPGDGWEVASPVLYGLDGLQEVKKMCESLQELGALGHDDAAGLHVHVGVSDLDDEHVAGLILLHHHLEQDIDASHLVSQL